MAPDITKCFICGKGSRANIHHGAEGGHAFKKLDVRDYRQSTLKFKLVGIVIIIGMIALTILFG